MIEIITLAFAVSAFSLTIARSSLFEGARDWAMGASPLLGKLLGCPYCLSHWAAAIVALVAPVRLHEQPIVSFALGTFALVGIASVISGVIFQLMLHPEHEVEKLRTKLIEARQNMQELIGGSDSGE